MNDPSNNQAPPGKQEDENKVLLSKARQCISHYHQQCEKKIRKEPMTAVVGAAAVGYMLHWMPVRKILVTQVRTLSALTPPALFFFGAVKLIEFFQKQDSVKRK